MDSELQDVKDTLAMYDRGDAGTGIDSYGDHDSISLGVLAKAARKYANLHESIDLDRLDDGLEFAHITDSDGDYLVYVAKQVQLALGVTG